MNNEKNDFRIFSDAIGFVALWRRLLRQTNDQIETRIKIAPSDQLLPLPLPLLLLLYGADSNKYL